MIFLSIQHVTDTTNVPGHDQILDKMTTDSFEFSKMTLFVSDSDDIEHTLNLAKFSIGHFNGLLQLVKPKLFTSEKAIRIL